MAANCHNDEPVSALETHKLICTAPLAVGGTNVALNCCAFGALGSATAPVHRELMGPSETSKRKLDETLVMGLPAPLEAEIVHTILLPAGTTLGHDKVDEVSAAERSANEAAAKVERLPVSNKEMRRVSE